MTNRILLEVYMSFYLKLRGEEPRETADHVWLALVDMVASQDFNHIHRQGIGNPEEVPDLKTRFDDYWWSGGLFSIKCKCAVHQIGILLYRMANRVEETYGESRLYIETTMQKEMKPYDKVNLARSWAYRDDYEEWSKNQNPKMWDLWNKMLDVSKSELMQIVVEFREHKQVKLYADASSMFSSDDISWIYDRRAYELDKHILAQWSFEANDNVRSLIDREYPDWKGTELRNSFDKREQEVYWYIQKSGSDLGNNPALVADVLLELKKPVHTYWGYMIEPNIDGMGDYFCTDVIDGDEPSHGYYFWKPVGKYQLEEPTPNDKALSGLLSRLGGSNA